MTVKTLMHMDQGLYLFLESMGHECSAK